MSLLAFLHPLPLLSLHPATASLSLNCRIRLLPSYGLTPLRVRAEGRERAEEGLVVLEGQQQVRPLGEDGSRRLFMREQVFLVHARSAPNTAISEATL